MPPFGHLLLPTVVPKVTVRELHSHLPCWLPVLGVKEQRDFVRLV